MGQMHKTSGSAEEKNASKKMRIDFSLELDPLIQILNSEGDKSEH